MASGFENAPIVRMVSVTVFIMSTALRSSNVALDMYRIMQGDWWRLFTSFFVFQNTAQAIVGLIILYSCRQFERQMGSRKFGAFLVFTMMLATLLSTAFVVVAASIGFHLVPSSGPFSLIFALTAYYYWYVPKLHYSQYAIGGLELSEKSWVYLLALQLMFSDGVPSVAAAVPGLMAGCLYEMDGFGFQEYRIPAQIESVVTRAGNFCNGFYPQPMQAPPQAPPQTGAPNRHNLQGHQGERERPRPVVQPPSEEAIATLTGMGFDREAVIRALQSTGNNLDAAANTLLR